MKIIAALVFGIFFLICHGLDVQNLGVNFFSHSQIQVYFTVSASYTSLRIRYTTTSEGSCRSGTGGSVINVTPNSGSWSRLTVTGLEPDTEYEVCPEAFDGVNWSSGVGIAQRTSPTPQVHPSLPIKPKTFDTSYPDTTGYRNITVAEDCSDLLSRFNEAIAVQDKTGTVISIPAGTQCTQRIIPTQVAPDRINFASSDVNVAASTITIPNHGFTEGWGVIFGFLDYTSALPTPQEPKCLPENYGGILAGLVYYVHVVDENTIQIYCGAKKDDGGALMTFSDAGHGPLYCYPYPRRLKHIIIRTSTPDSEFVPEGVRITPQWKPKMASFVKTVIGDGALMALGFGDPNDGHYMNHLGNIRFVGIEITTSNDTAMWTTSDPPHWGRLMSIQPINQNIVFDRCYIHGLGTPHRFYVGFDWNGVDQAIVDSYLEHLEYFHSAYNGLGITKTSDAAFTVNAGQHHMGGTSAALANTATIEFSGSGSGRAFVYFDMNNNNAFTVAYPDGVSPSTCNGAKCVYQTATTTNGACNWSDGWPSRDANGHLAVGQIACVDIANGVITAVHNADTTSQWWPAGCQFMIGGVGPGPYMFVNNYIQEVGNPWHHDDSGGFTWDRRDYTYVRNTFHVDMKHMWGSPVSDGHTYHHRQALEWKRGRQIEIIGNIFDGTFSEDIPTSVFVNFNAYSGATDVKISHNTFQHGPGGILVATYGANAYQPIPTSRVQIANNLFWDINGNYYRTPWQSGDGWALFNGASGIEDFVIDHNTILLHGGNVATFMYWGSMFHEGVNITNNIITIVGAITDGPYDNQYAWGYKGMRVDDVCGPGMQVGGDAFCGLKHYTFAGNVLVGNGPGADPTTISQWYPSIDNNCIAQTDLNGLCFSNYQQNNSLAWQLRDTPFNFTLTADTCSGCATSGTTDGKVVGADMDELDVVQGKVTLIGEDASQATESSMPVLFVAPDDFRCSVDYGTEPTLVFNFVRVQDTLGDGRSRKVFLPNLTPGTTYYYRVNCATQQPTGQFTFNGANAGQTPGDQQTPRGQGPCRQAASILPCQLQCCSYC